MKQIADYIYNPCSIMHIRKKEQRKPLIYYSIYNPRAHPNQNRKETGTLLLSLLLLTLIRDWS